MVDGQPVGDVGERSRALVGGHHQIRVVGIVAHHVQRRHDLAADDVVGDVQQGLDEQLVAGDAFGQHRIAVARHRRLLDEEPALRADRHDHGVLHHLCLHQPQHLGTEILAPVRPAQAAAGHRAEAQVHAFHARAVDEDLAVRTRLGQIRHLGRIELVADGRRHRAVLAALVVIGAQGGVDHADVTAQDAVFVEAGHAVEQFQQGRLGGGDLRIALAGARLHQLAQHRAGRLVTGHQRVELGGQMLLPLRDLRLALAAGGRVETGLEQLHQQAGQQRVAQQGLLHVGLRERHARLQQVFAIAAQQSDLAPAQPGRQHEAVEAVVLGIAGPYAGESLFEIRAHRGHVDGTGRGGHFEILDEDRRRARLQAVRVLGDHAQAHVFHQRQHVRQRDVGILPVQFQAQALAHRMQAQAQVVRAAQRGQVVHVVGCHFRRHFLDVAGRQGAAVTGRQREAAALAVTGDQRLAQVVLPVAQQMGQPRFQTGGVDVHLGAGFGPDDEVDLRQRRLAEQHAAVQMLAVQGFLQQCLDAQAHVGVEAVARDVHQHREEAAVAVAAQEQLAAHAFLQAEDAHRGAEQLFLAGLEQLLARQGFQDVAQCLAAVAVGRQAGHAHHVFVALAHQRDFPRAAGIGAGGEHAEETLLGHRAALGVVLEHADVIHVTGAVDRRTSIGLGQDQRIARLAGRQRIGAGVDRRIAHQAQARPGLRQQHVLPAALADAVFAVAEQGEVVVGHPAQELLRLAAAGVVHRQLARGQVVGQRQHLLAHRSPVLDGQAHLGQHFGNGRDDAVHGLGRLTVHLEHHQRFGLALAHGGDAAIPVTAEAHHRMAQHVHADAQFGQFHRHRIDEERHVVIDDLQHRMRRLPTMGLGGRVEHAHAGRARLATAGEIEQVQRQRGPHLGRVLREFVLGHAAIELADESLRFGEPGLGHAHAHCGEDGIEGGFGGGACRNLDLGPGLGLAG